MTAIVPSAKLRQVKARRIEGASTMRSVATDVPVGWTLCSSMTGGPRAKYSLPSASYEYTGTPRTGRGESAGLLVLQRIPRHVDAENHGRPHGHARFAAQPHAFGLPAAQVEEDAAVVRMVQAIDHHVAAVLQRQDRADARGDAHVQQVNP